MPEYTRFTNLQVTGALNAPGGIAGNVTGNVTGQLKGLFAATSISKSANYSLTDAEKTPYIGITLTSASKTVTLGLPNGTACIVVNEGGTNTFTAKNVSGDSGTSLAAGKIYLVKASTTANATTYTALT